MGVDPARIRTISYGKDKPMDSGHDESAWSSNRRDDFVLLHPKTGA
jgi:peptidoglycan-associated lipoprotein